MRYYKLLIDGKQLCAQSLDNPAGLNIQFNIQTYAEGQTATSEISVYNPPLWMFGEYTNLYNKKIELYAGVAETPLTKIIGMAPPKQDLIVSGFIGAILPQLNDADMQLTMTVTQSPVNSSTDVKGYQFRLKGDEDALGAIRAALDAVSPGVPVTSLESVWKVPAPCQTIVFSAAAIAQLVSTWGLVLLCGSEGYILKGRESAMYGQTVKLTRQDLLCQPSPLGVSSMAITSFLRGDIRLGDHVIMPDDTFVGVSNLSGVITDSSGIDAFLNSQNKNLYTMFSGTWSVSKMWHVGDLRSEDAQAWATHYEVVRV